MTRTLLLGTDQAMNTLTDEYPHSITRASEVVPLREEATASDLFAEADFREVHYWIDRLLAKGHATRHPSRVLASPGAPWEIK